MHPTPPRSLGRRRLLRTLIAGVGVVGAGPLIARQGPDPLDEEDPKARAVGYRHDHEAVDPERWPAKATAAGARQRCATCTLFIDLGEPWGLCSLFPGQRVNREGWCSVWSGN